MLPSSVPSHTKCFVDQAARAVKTAWLIESQRANYTGEEISDEQLTRYLAAYLAYVPASWQCSSHLQDLAILIDDEKMCSGLRV